LASSEGAASRSSTPTGGWTFWSDAEGGHVWHEDRVVELLERERTRPLYVSGTVSNQYTVVAHERSSSMAEKGPASYFPSIEKKYGRPVDEWLELIRQSPLERHMEIVNWLEAEHGLGHGHANALVGYVRAEQRP
jgi:Domain of unknown function (DUF4287)